VLVYLEVTEEAVRYERPDGR